MCRQACLYASFFIEIKNMTGGRRMEYLVNSRQMKMADQYTIQEKGVLSLTLMERAAESCVRVMDELGMDLS